jgi:hypothetical protein
VKFRLVDDIHTKEKTGTIARIKTNLGKVKAMVNVKKVILSIYVIIMFMFFCVVFSYSQEKPSEDVIKHYILTKNFPNISKYKNLRYESFKIKDSYFKKGRDKMDYYYVKVNYNISYKINKESGKPKYDNIVKNGDEFIFLKNGNKWYGKRGWE